jgi:hypothetical protein
MGGEVPSRMSIRRQARERAGVKWSERPHTRPPTPSTRPPARTWCSDACSSLTPEGKCARTRQLLAVECQASLRPPCLDR